MPDRVLRRNDDFQANKTDAPQSPDDYNPKRMPAQSSKLQVIHGQFRSACDRLAEVLAMPVDADGIVRDSAIQRFEFTFELFWKTLKAWATKRMDEVHTASDAVEYAQIRKLICSEEEELGRQLIRWRNMTSHLYEESMAEEIFSRIPGAEKFMREVIGRLAEKEGLS
jgi:nucleotidyltransferase substrate binding protein (TIGR01987 family)